ncbi:YihY/virulence factor BrkB family protein [Alloacidobacterium dinghuense]|uniref:YihY/virulence factor BrkB family protein n=1 Tax=Alloacidobacterium dinghuense TaxID=2763107 RepID=A0A7G8BEV4_9BACT|nr:YihY/virulence factor BrkB family protein [Alloacidobacterium dinghuense]QNI31074.1 YihY/virulence factor BrkB family protein [Alloacidobacterium dinghuense]
MLLWLWTHLRRAAWNAFLHNAFTTAKAAAYSGILSIFPAILTGTTLLALSPETETLGDIRSAFYDILPPDTMGLVQNYFQMNHARSVRLVWSATAIAILASSGFMLSIMEGFRRAYRLPRGTWNFWRERVVAFGLIPITLVPMFFATLLIVFGHQIERWMIDNADHALRLYVIFFWRLVRWIIAMLTSVAVLAVIYHFGTPKTQDWRRVVPGALLATGTWFLITIGYGLYVTRFADYSVVYGSLGAAVATLVWLYMVSISILVGAEFNAQIFPLQVSHPAAHAEEEEDVLEHGKRQTA